MQLKVKENKTDLRTFLSQNLGISRSKAKNLIDSRQIFVNDQRVWIATYKLKAGDIVDVPDIIEMDKTYNVDIIYEDKYIIAINKPSGLVIDEKNRDFENVLKNAVNCPDLRVIHRLDKETTGVLLFAKNKEIFEKFKNLWQDKKVTKVYCAICLNEANFDKKEIKRKIDGKEAESFVETVAISDGLSCFKITTKTGRKHQIRKHLADIGYPILGDKLYGPKIIRQNKFKKVTGQLLHSYQISYTCPWTGMEITIKAPLPDEFFYFRDISNVLRYKFK
ncbi:MAG: RluA family pseudouridine synthase [Candidatus Goldbacteria bacterium]|nr:RluA family pseudouridine synthase [Candidatus Goldiibacteriota bacterium]